MNESWEPVSDEDDDDYCLAAQALEYDMWEGQFDLIATDSITDYSERFNSEDLSCLPYFIPWIDLSLIWRHTVFAISSQVT